MIHNAMMIDRAASAVFAGAVGSGLVAVEGCLDRPEPIMNDRIKRLFKASPGPKRTKRGPRRCRSLGPLTCGSAVDGDAEAGSLRNEQRFFGLLFQRSMTVPVWTPTARLTSRQPH